MALNGETVEIRFHARAGQGSKVASNIFATGAMFDGNEAQAFPEYKADRTGAPMQTFVRVSKKEIRTTEPVIAPDILLVLDYSLLDNSKLLEGLKSDGLLIVNTSHSPDALKKKTGFAGEIHTIDATGIVLKLLGKNFPNVVMLGALSKLSGLVKVETLEKLFRDIYIKKLPSKLVDANIKAIGEGFKIK